MARAAVAPLLAARSSLRPSPPACGGRRCGRFTVDELFPKPSESPVERHLDCVRLKSEHLGDLASRQVGAVLERDELAVALAEAGHRGCELESTRGVVLEIAGCRRLRRLVDELEPVSEELADTAPRDPEQPGDGLATRRVV